MRVVDFGRSECQRIEHDLDAYINNELTEETSRAVAAHLEKCTSCAEELISRTRLRGMVKQAVQAQAIPGSIEARLRDRLRREATRSVLRSWPVPLTVAATVLLGAFATWSALRTHHEPWKTERARQEAYVDSLYARVSRVVQIGLGDHVHCAYSLLSG